MFSSIISPNIFLTNILLINLFSATATFALGVAIFFNNSKRPTNQVAFLIALFMGYWALSSTLTDVMRSPESALFWARTALVGAFFFTGLLVIFSYIFPEPARPLPNWKALLIMAPSLLILPFVLTEHNVVEVWFEDWGTGFTPGILIYLGLPYAVGFLTWAAVNFSRVRKRSTDPLIREQVTLVYAAITIVLISLLTTNAVLPIVFNYTKSGVFGAASSLVFVILMSYAIAAKGAMDMKVIATELLSYLLIFLTATQVVISDSVVNFVTNGIIFCLVLVATIYLIRSVRKEVNRRQELEVLSRELQEANRELSEMDNARSEFINIASHQLRTPVSVIKGYLALLEEGAYGKLTAKMKEKVRQMFEMNERLVHLINNFLNVSRIEKKRIEFLISTSDLGRMLLQAVEEMRFEAQLEGLELHGDVSAELPPVKADIEKVHEVLVNLIDNAVKYSEPKTRVTVTARPDEVGDFVVVRVTDGGIGLTEEEQARLFEKYYRAESKDMPHQQGSGLGLYICKTFIEGMGGRIWIESSEKGKGTTFAFQLPVAKPS